MDKDLVVVLSSVGFTNKEAQVYIALLSLGAGTVQQIATLSGLKRPIIYVLLEGLIQRGYVSEIPGKKIRAFQAMEAATDGYKLTSLISSSICRFSKHWGIEGSLDRRFPITIRRKGY